MQSTLIPVYLLHRSITLLACALFFTGYGPDINAATEQSTVEFDTSCSRSADAAFENGLDHLHNMMYAQADGIFSEAILEWPDCTMLHWGVAMSKFHPLWPRRPTPEAIAAGKSAVDIMLQHDVATDLERAFTNAVAAFYVDDTAEYPDRLAAWAKAQAETYRAFSDNVDAAALYALSLLATAPRGDRTFNAQDEAGQLLEKFNQTHPLHPGVIHYAIHAYDNPALYKRGIPFATEYGNIARDVPHALHMPSHIFVRSGQWQEVVYWNQRSAKAALSHSSQEKVSSHYAHALDYLIYAYLQQGKYDIAEQTTESFLSIPNHESNFGSAYALAASSVRPALEQSQWDEAADFPEEMHAAIEWAKFPQCEAMLWFAKGVGAARSGNSQLAQAAVRKLEGLATTLSEKKQGYWKQLVDGQRFSVEAWIAILQGDQDLAVSLQTKAADLEDKIGKSPVTPGHVLPARELLGDLYMILNRPQEAIKAYETVLKFAPNRQRSLASVK